MSEAHHPSYFLQQPEELDGNYYDDILGQNTFDVDNFDVDFGNNEHYPEEATSDQNIGPVKDHLNHKQPQAGLAHKEKKVQVDQEESGEDREDLSTLQNLATAYDQLNHEGPQAALSSEECQIDSDPNEFFGDRDDFSNLQKPSTQGSFNNGQLEDSVANGQQQFGSEFNANDWNIYENHIGNGGLSEIPETEAHHQQRILKRLEKGRHEGRQNRAHKHVSALQYEQYSHGSFGTPLNPSQLVVDSQQQLAVNTPGIDSARGTASMPREMTHGPVLGTSSKLSNIAGYPTFVNVPGSSGGMNIMINSSLDQDHGSREEENEEDEEDEEDDVPHQPTFETYGEHDPLIVQDPRQEKRGLTGRRNGQQVWFNPDTSKWRKFKLLYLTCNEPI